MKKVFKNNRIIVGLCSVLLAAGVCIGTNHYMISDSAGSVAAESQKADPLTRLAAAAEQDFDILEEEQESDNSPGWHTETQGSKTYKYYNNSAGNRLKGYRKIKKDYYFFSQKSGYAVCNGWKYVRIKGKKYKLYFDKKGRRSDPTKKLGSKARYQIRVSLRDNMVTIYAKDGAKGFIIPVKAMVCSVGMSGHTTRKGTYSLSRSGRWHVLRYNSNGQYATRYSGPYMFHSVTYDRLGNHYSLQAAEYRKLARRHRMVVFVCRWRMPNGFTIMHLSRQRRFEINFPKDHFRNQRQRRSRSQSAATTIQQIEPLPNNS